MRIKSKTVMDQMNAEKPDDVLADLEAKHGCAAPSGSATFATYFLRNEKWYLHSWGISRDDAMDALNEVWCEQRRSGVDGIKLEPTPEVLKSLPMDQSPAMRLERKRRNEKPA